MDSPAEYLSEPSLVDAAARRSVEAILNPYSTKSTEKLSRLSESQVRQISEGLGRLGKESWSRVPRVYAVLHMTKNVHVIDAFIGSGISDLWFPFSHKTLPECLRSPSARFEFLELQDYVLTKALDLERDDGRHRHFSKGDELPLQKIEELGKGGFGYVDRVVSTITYKEYARKLIPRGRTFKKNAEVLKDFERELGHLKKLSHMHIVELIGSYTDSKFVGILMAPVADYNLKDFLARADLSTGDRSFLRTFYGCLAAALCYLHEEQVRHKDIKPQNVLVKGHQVFLTDFGISLDWSDLDQSTTTGVTIKTPRYCAPEVAGFRPRNSSSDVWSLGCVFLEIWTVLKSETVSALVSFLGGHGSLSTCYFQNQVAVDEWCHSIGSRVSPSEEDVAHKWIAGMMQHDPDSRWSAQQLVDTINEVNDDPDVRYTFSGICCIADDDSTASSHSSKRSSQALDQTGASSVEVYVPKSLRTDRLVVFGNENDPSSTLTARPPAVDNPDQPPKIKVVQTNAMNAEIPTENQKVAVEPAEPIQQNKNTEAIVDIAKGRADGDASWSNATVTSVATHDLLDAEDSKTFKKSTELVRPEQAPEDIVKLPSLTAEISRRDVSAETKFPEREHQKSATGDGSLTKQAGSLSHSATTLNDPLLPDSERMPPIGVSSWHMEDMPGSQDIADDHDQPKSPFLKEKFSWESLTRGDDHQELQHQSLTELDMSFAGKTHSPPRSHATQMHESSKDKTLISDKSTSFSEQGTDIKPRDLTNETSSQTSHRPKFSGRFSQMKDFFRKPVRGKENQSNSDLQTSHNTLGEKQHQPVQVVSPTGASPQPRTSNTTPQDEDNKQTDPVAPKTDPPKPPVTRRCGKCQGILDGQFVRALDDTFHLNCFTCADCGRIVASKFFPSDDASEAGKKVVLCETDYFRRLDLICYKCGGALRGSYITSLNQKYHLDHFTCTVCDIVFGETDSYYEYENNVYCHFHYSTMFAQKCHGCHASILQQFVEIFRNGTNQHWHPECYMIHKFWNTRLSTRQHPEASDKTVKPPTGALPTEDERSMCRATEEVMESKRKHIWEVLSVFEEKMASYISDMLLHSSQYDIEMALHSVEKFLGGMNTIFCVIIFIDGLCAERGLRPIASGREAKLLCKKVVAFLEQLRTCQHAGQQGEVVTQKSLSNVTGIAHYLKLLIRLCLTKALAIEDNRPGTNFDFPFMSEFLDAIKGHEQREFHVLGDRAKLDQLASEKSELCSACFKPIEADCFRFKHDTSEMLRIHHECLTCKNCMTLGRKNIAGTTPWTTQGGNSTQLVCSKCQQRPASDIEQVERYMQYIFLLTIAMARVATSALNADNNSTETKIIEIQELE